MKLFDVNINLFIVTWKLLVVLGSMILGQVGFQCVVKYRIRYF